MALIASSLRAIREDRDIGLQCPACGAGWTSISLFSVSDAGPVFKCSDCSVQFSGQEPLPELSQEDAPGIDPAYWSAQVQWIAGHLERTPGTVLDVGCGEGGFLSAWPEGVEKRGIEPNEERASCAAENGVRLVNFGSERDQLDGVFDVVTCYDVLNRSHYARHVFGLLTLFVKPGGLLAVQIPTYEGHHIYMAETRSKAWTMCIDEQRKTYYSRKFLQNCFGSLGMVRVAEAWNSGLEEPENVRFDRYCALFRKELRPTP